jgi:hypothetical protein
MGSDGFTLATSKAGGWAKAAQASAEIKNILEIIMDTK